MPVIAILSLVSGILTLVLGILSLVLAISRQVLGGLSIRPWPFPTWQGFNLVLFQEAKKHDDVQLLP